VIDVPPLRGTAISADICHEQRYRSGEAIFHEGEPGNRELAYKILWSLGRLLSGRPRAANDNLGSLPAMPMV
jgi:hypothetical protein